MSDLISIIVPFYNTEKYLPDCLNSLSNQSYKDIEVVLIDNGSTDNSVKICTRFASMDPRIKIYACTQRGASNARNYGLEVATGKYIMFVDSDDTVEPNFCSDMYETITALNAELAVCGVNQVSEDLQLENRILLNNTKKCLLTNEQVFSLFHKELLNSLWNKIFLRDFITFKMKPEYRIGEDLDFVIHYLMKIQKVAYSDKCLYNNRNLRKRGAELHRYYWENRLNTVLDLYDEMIELSKRLDMHDDSATLLKQYYSNTILYTLRESSTQGKKEVEKTVKESIKSQRVQNIIEGVQLDSRVKQLILSMLKKHRKRLLVLLLQLYALKNRHNL